MCTYMDPQMSKYKNEEIYAYDDVCIYAQLFYICTSQQCWKICSVRGPTMLIGRGVSPHPAQPNHHTTTGMGPNRSASGPTPAPQFPECLFLCAFVFVRAYIHKCTYICVYVYMHKDVEPLESQDSKNRGQLSRVNRCK